MGVQGSGLRVCFLLVNHLLLRVRPGLVIGLLLLLIPVLLLALLRVFFSELPFDVVRCLGFLLIRSDFLIPAARIIRSAKSTSGLPQCTLQFPYQVGCLNRCRICCMKIPNPHRKPGSRTTKMRPIPPPTKPQNLGTATEP